MTIAAATNRIVYPGAGSIGPYTVPFRVFAATDLRVLRVSVNGAETVLALNGGYTVDGVGNATCTVTLASALADGETLVIRRAPPLVQPASFQNQGQYFGKSHEDALDRILMQIQALNHEVERTLRLRESVDPFDRLTPAAGALLGVDGTGSGWTTYTPDGIAVAIPGGGRTVATLTAYLDNNKTFNVKDFGAVGNAIHDDTAAIQAAIDAAQLVQGEVVFPGVAEYYVTSSLVITGPVKLRGLGTKPLIASDMLGAGEPLIDVDGTVAPNLEYVIIENFELYAGASANCIRINRASQSAFRDITVRNCTDGIVVTGNRTYSLTFERILAENACTHVGILFSVYTGGGHHTITGCGFTSCEVGILIDSNAGVGGITILSCNFEGCEQGIALLGGAAGMHILGCRFESNGSYDINMSPDDVTNFEHLYGLVISGCTFWNSGGPITLGGNGGHVRGFLITGNYNRNAAAQFIRFNGDGETGLVCGNFLGACTVVVDVLRAGVLVLNNENNVGAVGSRWKAPLVTPAAIAAPSAPSAGYVQAEAASMKTAVDAIRAILAANGMTA